MWKLSIYNFFLCKENIIICIYLKCITVSLQITYKISAHPKNKNIFLPKIMLLKNRYFEECFNCFAHTVKVSGVQNNFDLHWLSL